MSPGHDDVLRQALRERSGRQVVPQAPIDQLLAGGRQLVRRRRRRLATGIGIAATLVAVAGALALQPDAPRSDGPVSPTPPPRTDAPRTLAELPRGDPPTVPFADRGTLYTSGIATDLEDGDLTTIARGHDPDAGTWTVATSRTRGDGTAIDLLDLETGDKAGHVADVSANRVTVSADGKLVAWEDDNADGTARVRLWDVSSRSLAATVSFPFSPTCCDNPFLLSGVDAQGRVYGSGGTTAWVASVGGHAQAITGLGATAAITEVGASLVVVDDQGSERVGRVGPDARFVEEFRGSGWRGTISWDEALFASTPSDDRVLVRDVSGAGERTIAMPADVLVTGDLVWETPTELLVQVQVQARAAAADENALLRCSAETGKCELAAMLPDETPTLPSR